MSEYKRLFLLSVREKSNKDTKVKSVHKTKQNLKVYSFMIGDLNLDFLKRTKTL